MNKAAKIAISLLVVLVGTLAYFGHNAPPPRDASGGGCKAGCWRVQVDGPNDYKCQNPYLLSALKDADEKMTIGNKRIASRKLDDAMVISGRIATGKLDSDSERFRDALMRKF